MLVNLVKSCFEIFLLVDLLTYLHQFDFNEVYFGYVLSLIAKLYYAAVFKLWTKFHSIIFEL